jgi:hypothetical protein
MHFAVRSVERRKGGCAAAITNYIDASFLSDMTYTKQCQKNTISTSLLQVFLFDSLVKNRASSPATLAVDKSCLVW